MTTYLRRVGWGTVVAVVVVVAVVAAGIAYFVWPSSSMTVTADFARTDAIFSDSNVTILGVPSGKVQSVTPQGSTVRVVMSLPEDTMLPADTNAWVLSPSVISDRTVELGPGYTSGPTLADGATISAERTHAPVTWDELTTSINQLITAVGPGEGDGNGGVGPLLSTVASSVQGNGQAFHDAITSISQASTVLAGKSGDISALIDGLNTLVQAIADNRASLDSLGSSLAGTSAQFDAQRDQLSNALSTLPEVLGQVSAIISAHGSDLTSDTSQLAAAAGDVAARQAQLTEIIDTLPVGFQNVANVVTPDGHARVRIDVSTQLLTQFPDAAKYCATQPLPFCQGPGMVNPVDPPAGTPTAAEMLGGGR